MLQNYKRNQMLIRRRVQRILLTAFIFVLVGVYDLYEWSEVRGSKLKLKVTSADAEEQSSSSFSACLHIKDANALLPEWLAYHYTILPLRRLIVAVDPMSYTDPRPILNAYKSIGLNITVWMNEDTYWEDGRYAHEKLNWVVPNKNDTNYDEKLLLGRLRHKGKVFWKACLRTLKEEGRTWTAFVDVDEYIAFNYHDSSEGIPTFCRGNRTCEENFEQSIKDGTHYRARLDESSTVAEHIHRRIDHQFDVLDKPCVVIARYLFVSIDECNKKEFNIRRGIYDKNIDASMFHTIRYRCRTPLSAQQERGKSIVDVSRYDGRDVSNAHRLLGNLCTGHTAAVRNELMSFRVHHYVGSWETFRRPGYDARGKEEFIKRNNQANLVVDDTTPGYSRYNKAWISEFGQLIGKERAFSLTQSIRMYEELKLSWAMLDQLSRVII